MKFIIPMLMLTTLVSCQESHSTKSKMSREAIMSAMTNIPRGMVMVTTTTGKTYNFSSANGGELSATVADNNSVKRSIVVKIDGDDIYKHVTTVEGTDTRIELEVEKMVTEQDYKDVLARPGTTISGNILRFSIEDDGNGMGDWGGAVFQSRYRVTGQVNLANPHCSSISKVLQFNSSITQNGVVTKLPDLSSDDVSTCEANLSAQQLKAIDLSNIEVCVEQEGDAADICEMKNMSHLTADL